MEQRFLTNYTELTFLDKIRQSLRTCTSFAFSVSFIKKAGLALLIKDMEAAVRRGAKGRLITSTYQNFTDIESLYAFLSLQSTSDAFSCRLDKECFHDSGFSTLGFHAKGYLFTFAEHTEVIIGSSNITRYALLKNIEWDVVVPETEPSAVYAAAMAEFEEKWEKTCPLTAELIQQYALQLNYAIERWDMDYDLSAASVKPNFMQRKALRELNRYRAMGTSRALVVAAAGSGKTYLAAFDALNFGPKRLLYVVHEGSILQKSLETFQQVFGNSVTYGLYTGQAKELDAQFLFSTNFSMAKTLQELPATFSPDTFDYIVIDECHHAAAETYKKIISYFTPEFLIGLTATPERMDNQDVFELFDKNVPYELRLRDAILNGLVVPFRYYGIRDTLINYGLNKAEERRLVAELSTAEHCAFVTEQIEKHRPEGEKLKALAFCRNIQHARMMCEGMGERYRTAFLSGGNSVGERIRAYNELQSEDEGSIEILFAVDILNEGVDIPGVNMVLFLRPTDSSTIFIQQLGRGLRKFTNKNYVTVLDFIGNSYKRSVQIAFALSSLAQNFVIEKRLMVSLLADDFKPLGLVDSGVEIHIDDLSKEEMKNFLENENFNRFTYLKQDFANFRAYIRAETWPRHVDYLNNDCAPDLIRFLSVKINNKKCCSYYNFLHGILAGQPEENFLPVFTEEQVRFINTLSGLLPLERAHEYSIVKLLANGRANKQELERALRDAVPGFSEESFTHALHFMEQDGLIKEEEGACRLNVTMDSEFSEYLQDLLAYGLQRYAGEYGEETGFIPYLSYRMDQVQRKLLKNPGFTMYGTYYYGEEIVIFASIRKDLDPEVRTNYKDKFLAPELFQWESVNNISKTNLQALDESDHALLFIRKVDEENGITLPFTYIGKGKLTNKRPLHGIDSKTGKPYYSFLYDIVMEQPLPDYLQYDFGLNENV